MAFSKQVMFPVVLSCIIVNLSFAGCLSNDTKVGGWKKIDDLNDPEIKAIANFALEEASKIYEMQFTFVRVDEGKQQIAKEGTSYELLIVAYSGSVDELSRYEAEIWVQPYRKHQELVYFGLHD